MQIKLSVIFDKARHYAVIRKLRSLTLGDIVYANIAAFGVEIYFTLVIRYSTAGIEKRASAVFMIAKRIGANERFIINVRIFVFCKRTAVGIGKIMITVHIYTVVFVIVIGFPIK